MVDFSASPSRAYVGDTITFFANASSDVSPELTFTVYFDSLLASYANNTQSPVYSTTAGNPGFMTTTYAYDHLGNLSSASGTYFRAKLYVGDGTNTVSTSISVYIVDNAAPTFTLKLPGNVDVSVDVPVSFATTVADVDDDPLVVTWDFGDGSDLAVNTTGPSADGVTVVQSHSWSPYLEPGLGDYFIYYWMNLTVEDDAGHSTESSTKISIYIPYNFAPVATFFVNSTAVDPDDIVMLHSSVTDREGDSLTWTYEFRNDTGLYNTVVHKTPATADNTTLWNNMTHQFSQPGNYTVTFWISDVLDPDLQVFPDNSSKTIAITSALNYAPQLQANISFSPQLIYLDEASGIAVAQLSIEGYDPDGDVVYATWGFGDGSDPGQNTSGGTRLPYKFVQIHEYVESGMYNVSCAVTDGREGHEVVRYLSLVIRSNNSAPEWMGLTRTLSNGTFATANTNVTLTLTVSDEEMDRVRIGWSFGDNSSLIITEVSEYDEDGNGTSTVQHVYTALGDYTVVIWFTDDKFDSEWHNDSRNVTISVRTAWVKEVIVWDAWDYISLSLFLGAIASVFIYAWFASRFRKNLDSKGLTYDEYKIMRREKAEAERAKQGSKAAPEQKTPSRDGKEGGR
ncbi:MAG: hypothetical protein AB1793_02405 [Candidatus Thermoplasmatota archaeon]